MSGMRQRCPLSSLLFNIVLKVLAEAMRQERETKGIQVGKEEIKTPSSPYLQNARTLLETINTFNNMPEYKIKL